MSKWKDGEWILNFFEGQPDYYHVPLGALRACVKDAPTIEPNEQTANRKEYDTPKGKEMIKAMPMEDWLRGCVYHDGRSGYVTLPTDKVLEIADYIQTTRTNGTDGLIELPPRKEGEL